MLPSLQPTPSDATTFDDFVASHHMPPPGPDFYRARRQLWLTPRPHRSRSSRVFSISLTNLEHVLQTPEAVYSDSCWEKGIGKVWKGLSKGERLKYRLPLSVIIKVVHASWVRDDTWPAGLRAPEPDDELADEISNEPMVIERIVGTNPHLQPAATS